MMTSSERIRAMINHQPFDRIGVAGWVHMPFVDHNVTDMTRATIMVRCLKKLIETCPQTIRYASTQTALWQQHAFIRLPIPYC